MHTPTIFAVMTLASAVMALSLTIAAWKRYPDLQAWAAALGLQAAGYSFFVLRASMPEGWFILLGNGALSAAMALYAYGLYRFANRAPNQLALYVPMALVLAVNLVWLHDLHTRFLLHSVLYAGQASLVLVLLHRCRTPGTERGALILGLGVALFMLVMLSRFVAVSTGGINIAAYNESNAVQVVTFLISLASTLMLSVGILLMLQQRAENQLAISERHYRQLVDAATDGICIVQGSTIRYANPRMHQLLGYSADTMAGTPIQNLVSAEDWPMVQHNHQQRLAGHGDDLKYPTRMNTRHAGVRWFEISGVHIEWQGQAATLNFLTDITERRNQEDAIKGLAYHDTLTQLPNRRLLLDRLGQAQTSSLRNHTWAGLVFLDLDRFKILNDTHGHHAGDLLLVEVARRLVACVRGIDTVARLGGDEFVVLLCDLGNTHEQASQGARHVAQKMLNALAQPYRLTQQEDPDTVVQHQCSASAGLVLFTGHTTAAETLLEQADAAMYNAKKAGRNQLCIHSPDTATAH